MISKKMDVKNVPVDPIESAEWCEIPDDDEEKNPQKKQITIKRKALRPLVPATYAKRTLKSEVISDQIDSADIFIELDDTPKPTPTPKSNQIKFISAKNEVVPLQVLSKPTSLPVIAKLLPSITIREINKTPEVADQQRTIEEPITEKSTIPDIEPVPPTEPALPFEGLKKLENVIERCVQLVEKCISQNNHKQAADSNEIFGNFVSTMVRELPAGKRMIARVEILQFTGELIARLSNETK